MQNRIDAMKAAKAEETRSERWAMHGFTFFGLQLAATPLLLWVAWSPTVLYLILANALFAGLGAIVCYRFTAVPKPRYPTRRPTHLPQVEPQPKS